MRTAVPLMASDLIYLIYPIYLLSPHPSILACIHPYLYLYLRSLYLRKSLSQRVKKRPILLQKSKKSKFHLIPKKPPSKPLLSAILSIQTMRRRYARAHPSPTTSFHNLLQPPQLPSLPSQCLPSSRHEKVCHYAPFSIFSHLQSPQHLPPLLQLSKRAQRRPIS
jgi:hypothetical protein